MDIVERLRVRNTPYGHLELMDKAADEIERLRAAIEWALGAKPDPSGRWFGECKPDQPPPFWWRKPLRNLAGMGLAYDKASRTIVRLADEQNARGRGRSD